MRPQAVFVLAMVAAPLSSMAMVQVSVPLPELLISFALTAEIFLPSEAVRVQAPALPPSVKISTFLSRASSLVSTLERNFPDMAPAAKVLSLAVAERMIWSPAFKVDASVTSAALLDAGSAANTDTGSRETSMTSDSSVDRSLVRTGVFIRLLPPLISPGASRPTGIFIVTYASVSFQFYLQI